MCPSLKRTHIHCNILFTELIHWNPCPRYFLSQVRCSGSASGDGVGRPKGPWPFPPEYIIQKTRLHSSRMRTARALTDLPACSAPGGACSGVSQHALRQNPPWTEWQTDVKILPFPKLRLRAVKNQLLKKAIKNFQVWYVPTEFMHSGSAT